MMGLFSNLMYGFSAVFQPANLLYCFVGVFLGTLVGVLPGIGPAGTMSILLPVTFGTSPLEGIIMLGGIYYGAMYGGSTTSILVNIPGEAASVVSCLDGYQMARKGRAGPALGISAMGSFIGGTLSVIGLMLIAIPLSAFALKFGPPELFAVMSLGLGIVLYLNRGSLIKGVIMVIFGLILGCVGMDFSGKGRFVFGISDLSEGINFIPLIMGLFGISEILSNIDKPFEKRSIYKAKVKNLLPNLEDWRKSIKPILRGTVIGFFLGVLPGGGSIISSFASYAVEKRVSKHPEEFGQGAIEGLAGPETANNAATAGCFVPLMSLGIPTNAIMALLFGALIIHGISPGPFLIQKHPDIFWGVVASMYLGNVMLLILNLPLIGMWVQVLKVPYRFLFPLIIMFCLIGTYSINNSIFDVLVMMVFGIIGYVLKKFEYAEAPLVLAFILGPMMEMTFRQSLAMSNGQLSIFFIRPISCVTMIVSIALGITTLIRIFKTTRGRGSANPV